MRENAILLHLFSLHRSISTNALAQSKIQGDDTWDRLASKGSYSRWQGIFNNLFLVPWPLDYISML